MRGDRLVLLWLALVVADPALALRCGNRLVDVGDPMPRVHKFCGDPVDTQTRTIWRRVIPTSDVYLYRDGELRSTTDDELLINDRSFVEVVVDEWTYNFGPQKFMCVIRFENGSVAHIDTLGYGYLE